MSKWLVICGLLLLSVSSVVAVPSINLMETHQTSIISEPVLDKLNHNEIVQAFINDYDLIQINIDDMQYFIEIQNNNITNVYDSTNQKSDYIIESSAQEVLYLLLNYQEMGKLQFLKYLTSLDVPITVMMRLAAMGVGL